MTTGTAGNTATRDVGPLIHRLYKAFTYADDGSALVMGVIPASTLNPACVIACGVVVSAVFDAGSTNVLDIGTSADDDGFATDLALGTIGVITGDSAIATSNDAYLTADTTIIATVDLTGTAATAGAAVAWVEYFIMN